MEVSHLIAFWEMYNRHIIELITAMPKDSFRKECNTGGAEPHSLEWLFDDYVQHLQYHIRQVAA